MNSKRREILADRKSVFSVHDCRHDKNPAQGERMKAHHQRNRLAFELLREIERTDPRWRMKIHNILK